MFKNLFSRQKNQHQVRRATKVVSADAARVPEDIRLVAVGDIHGRHDCLKQLLGNIGLSDKSKDSNWHFIFLGDYIDRGPYSRSVIDHLINFSNVHSTTFLLGNHERAMLNFLDAPVQARDWLKFGGRETLLSYGVTPPNGNVGPDELKRMGEDLRTNLPAAHHNFLNSLELLYVCGDYLFTHAGIDPEKPIKQQSESELLWIREPFLSFPDHLPKVIVHGHTVTENFRPEVRSHRLGIDTGAYICGNLTAAIFTKNQFKFVSSKD